MHISGCVKCTLSHGDIFHNIKIDLFLIELMMKIDASHFKKLNYIRVSITNTTIVYLFFNSFTNRTLQILSHNYQYENLFALKMLKLLIFSLDLIDTWYVELFDLKVQESCLP